ncbi:putative SIR2 family histone deacetylase [Aspergillus steynii IBT 23096]|uniref:Putative SIR2 family histone deacetylase n=1 Tax=Aspergillus steynii IBT 23096 TaxID=1392250 RepID=A0A2I2FTG4_9EURO|nr:putative SIR2 family histone deacetylase [Aspergillus steynii IBT 23096]PLB43904.1 putative SIR2 family histone deacetylase [Aspergillus steynii IBT 23096]
MDDDFSDVSELSSAPASPSPPPGFYPSPPPSQDADESRQAEAAPARKKRRTAAPKERRTQRLDLRLGSDDQQQQVDLLTKTLRRHRKIVVIAGAGISTSAGIPDFRSTDGLFKSLQKKHNLKASGKLLFDAAVYQDETLTASFQDMVRSLSEEAEKTSPTAFHHMLARLGHEGRLTRLYTQNIDGIETSMPPLATQIPLNVKAPWPRTIQLHGSLDKMVCQKCRHLGDFDRVMFDRPDAPECPACSKNNQFRMETGQRSHGIGKMRPRIVLYNEHNPDEEAITSVMNADIRSRPDALVVVGTSLKIPGVRRLVKSLCQVIRTRRNGTTMWINNEPPVGKEFEDCWDLVVTGDCEEVARLAALKRWDDHSEEVFDECNQSEVERVKKGSEVSIVVSTPRKRQKTATGFLTPSSSQDEEGRKSQVPANTRANPASRGPKLEDVLKGNKTAAAPKKGAAAKKKPAAAPRKRAKKEAPAKNTKITTFSKVTKAPKVAAEDKSVKLEKDDSKPMHPLPPGAARNNGPMFPHLSQKGDTTPTRNSSSDWRQPDTISPKSVPNGMSELLNQPTA